MSEKEYISADSAYKKPSTFFSQTAVEKSRRGEESGFKMHSSPNETELSIYFGQKDIEQKDAGDLTSDAYDVEELTYKYRLLETYTQDYSCFLYLNWIAVIVVWALIIVAALSLVILVYSESAQMTICPYVPDYFYEICIDPEKLEITNSVYLSVFLTICGAVLSFLFLVAIKAFNQKKSGL